MHWRQYLRIRTRTPAFLWKLVLGILLGGLVLGFAAQWVLARSASSYVQRLALASAQGSTKSVLSTLDEMLADRELPVEQLLDALAVLERPRPKPRPGELLPRPVAEPIDSQAVQGRLAASPLAPEVKTIALALWQSLADGELSKELTELAARTPPVRFANQAVGVICESHESDYEAAAAFEREGQFPAAKDARKRAIAIYTQKDDVELLARLSDDPVFAGEIPASARMRIAAAARQWWKYWWLAPVREWESLAVGPALLALFTGSCWFVFSLQAGQVGTARGARWWMCAAALVCGVLSIWPTDLLIAWQRVEWGLTESDDLAAGIRYYVLGVGLREELSKLLLFLPLVPLLVRRGNELETLIVAACVGLGFATVENSLYFRASFGASSIGRFLTANFLHMAATGLVGLAVVRGIQHPRAKLAESLVIFGVIVVAHGMYDAAIDIPALAEYQIATPIIYILLAYQFFHELRNMRIENPETVSLTATFLCGVSLVTAVTFIYISGQLGFRLAVTLLVPEAISMVVMVVMFLREMPGSLAIR